MPRCSILECKNDSKRKNPITYHRFYGLNDRIDRCSVAISGFKKFPKYPSLKEKWVDATGRVDWMPTKASTICSDHFLEEDFLISEKGYRYTKPKAVPSLKIVKVFNEPQDINDTTAGPSKRQGDSESSNLTQPKKVRLHHYSMESKRGAVKNVHDMGVSEHSKMKKKELRLCKDKIKKQGLKIKQGQSKNIRLKKKINSIDEILTILGDKFPMALPCENIECLRDINLEVEDLVAREGTNTESGPISRQEYSSELRSFALTLYFYSAEAYAYVRKTFHTNLPHTRILKNWYVKVGGEPGFTKESFVALKKKAELSTKPLLATL